MTRHPVVVLTSNRSGGRALEVAVALALEHHGELSVVHIRNTTPPWWAGTSGAAGYRAAQREAQAEGERFLDEVRASLPLGLTVHTVLVHGKPGGLARQALAALARDGRDLLVVEAPGAWPGPPLYEGSWLIRNSPIPVLTAPATASSAPVVAPAAAAAPGTAPATVPPGAAPTAVTPNAGRAMATPADGRPSGEETRAARPRDRAGDRRAQRRAGRELERAMSAQVLRGVGRS